MFPFYSILFHLEKYSREKKRNLYYIQYFTTNLNFLLSEITQLCKYRPKCRTQLTPLILTHTNQFPLTQNSILHTQHTHTRTLLILVSYRPRLTPLIHCNNPLIQIPLFTQFLHLLSFSTPAYKQRLYVGLLLSLPVPSFRTHLFQMTMSVDCFPSTGNECIRSSLSTFFRHFSNSLTSLYILSHSPLLDGFSFVIIVPWQIRIINKRLTKE